jgi:hypothetical protein
LVKFDSQESVDMWMDSVPASNMLSTVIWRRALALPRMGEARILYPDVCYIVGSSLGQPLAQGVADTPSRPRIHLRRQTVTPAADGSIVHEVQYRNQSLFAVPIPVNDPSRAANLNGLAENNIIALEIRSSFVPLNRHRHAEPSSAYRTNPYPRGAPPRPPRGPGFATPEDPPAIRHSHPDP